MRFAPRSLCAIVVTGLLASWNTAQAIKNGEKRPQRKSASAMGQKLAQAEAFASAACQPQPGQLVVGRWVEVWAHKPKTRLSLRSPVVIDKKGVTFVSPLVSQVVRSADGTPVVSTRPILSTIVRRTAGGFRIQVPEREPVLQRVSPTSIEQAFSMGPVTLVPVQTQSWTYETNGGQSWGSATKSAGDPVVIQTPKDLAAWMKKNAATNGSRETVPDPYEKAWTQ